MERTLACSGSGMISGKTFNARVVLHPLTKDQLMIHVALAVNYLRPLLTMSSRLMYAVGLSEPNTPAVQVMFS